MIDFKKTDLPKIVPDEVMREVYERIKTPYKWGPVVKFERELCDSPAVFRYNGKWYMSFIKIDKDVKSSGYDSHLAVSDDLVHWEYLYKTMQREDNGAWDSKQIALYAAFIDNDLYGSYEIEPIDGEYYFAYLGGALDGYETDPLAVGLCKTKDVLDPKSYTRISADGPIMGPTDPDCRHGETKTLYKSHMFRDEAKTTGYTFVSAYNAKDFTNKESIFLAVSNDGVSWERYGDRAVIVDDTKEQNVNINGDPQIFKIGDLYVMFYFIAKDGCTYAYETFACSYDLEHFTKWQGEPLIKPELVWEDLFAHKPCIVYNDGVLYHYYCACNKKGERFIALATNRELDR